MVESNKKGGDFKKTYINRLFMCGAPGSLDPQNTDLYHKNCEDTLVRSKNCQIKSIVKDFSAMAQWFENDTKDVSRDTDGYLSPSQIFYPRLTKKEALMNVDLAMDEFQ